MTRLDKMTDDAPPMASARMAAGALFLDEAGSVLLVKPTYKPGWEIPGGYVEPGESPAGACARELKEELGIDRAPAALLVVDWAPQDGLGDKLLFVFDGGTLDPNTALHLPADELSEYRYWPAEQLGDVLPDRLARRIHAALVAHEDRAAPAYLEHGQVVGGS